MPKVGQSAFPIKMGWNIDYKNKNNLNKRKKFPTKQPLPKVDQDRSHENRDLRGIYVMIPKFWS